MVILPDPSSSLRIEHPTRSATRRLLPLLKIARATGQLNRALSAGPSTVAGGSPAATMSSLPPTVATALVSRSTRRMRSLPLSATYRNPSWQMMPSGPLNRAEVPGYRMVIGEELEHVISSSVQRLCIHMHSRACRSLFKSARTAPTLVFCWTSKKNHNMKMLSPELKGWG